MRYFLSLVGALLLCGCGGGSSKTAENQPITVADGVITVDSRSAILGKFKTEKIALTTYRPQFSTSGVVKAIPTSYAQIATPFAGRIAKSFVRLGQSVAVGSALFELSSPSFFETGKAYFGAKQQMEQALKNLNREKDLLANHVGVQKEVEQAEVDYQLKRQEFENTRLALKVFQVDPDAVKLGEPLIIRSPIAGKVVMSNIVMGQYIKEDSEPLVVVADLKKVWVVANVKEKDIRLIERLQEVDITLSASPEEPIKGVVYHISEMLDQATRSVEVIVECDNKDGRMKPFMYGSVQLTDKATEVILVPSSAILQHQDQNYVIVALGDNKFRKTPVAVESVAGDKIVVTSGIAVGDEIITVGAFYLLGVK